jgi:hypothetical protein
MDYRFKSAKIFPYFLVCLLFSFITILDLFHIGFLKFHFVIVCEVIFIILFWYITGRLLYLLWFKKPALSISQDGIFDGINHIKYQWNDIEELSEDGTLLRIKLREPRKYLTKIGDPVQQIITFIAFLLNSKKSPYVIYTSLLSSDKDELLKAANSYMIKGSPIKN